MLERWSKRRTSLRYRLLVLTLFPLLLVLPGVIGLAYLWSQEVGYRQLLMKANTDLAVAHEAFLNSQQSYLMNLSLAASHHHRLILQSVDTAPTPVATTQRQSLEDKLKDEAELDFVRLLDLNHCKQRTDACQHYPTTPLMAKAFNGQTVSAIEIFSARQLNNIDPILAQRARIPMINSDISEQRGMLIHLFEPIRNDHGEVIGALAAGVLMNGNFALVDQIRNTVYGPGSLPEGGIGTVTLFLDDVRISTNVPHPNSPERRALGTKVSTEVHQQVLGQGQRWLDRAFVVNDWYISAYEPVIDASGKRVGMLYAGFLESPFLDSFYYWLELLLWLFAVVLIGCAIIAVRGARSISKPLEHMTEVMDRVREGQHQTLPHYQSSDEIQELALHFNAMLSQLDTQHHAIQSAADQFEEKVNQRTAQLKHRTDELQQHIALLNRTREQLIEQGKLAALGELTAGIAHEINNPTAVILGYMDLLLDELGDQATPEMRHDAELIIAQVDRIRTIINDLLKLARPVPETLTYQTIHLNEVIRKTQTLVKHELQRRGIHLTLDLNAQRPAYADAPQLQQVLINLVMNAANATEEKGEIIVRSHDSAHGWVKLTIRDNGSGIEPQHLNRIFDPFFSTSHSGTGLGLAISHRLLSQMNAQIKVRSRLGHGSVFFIWFNTDKQ